GVVTVSNPLPNIAAADLTPLTYTFYDRYDFTGAQAAAKGDSAKLNAGSNPYKEAFVISTMTKGLVTGTKVRIIDTDQWLTTTSYYNDKGRPVQTIADNATGGRDTITNQYDFNGKLLSSYQRHRNIRSGSVPQVTTLTMMSYDATGKLIAVKKRFNDADSLERTVASNEYDELGQLKTKRLGIKGTGAPITSMAYEYNIRGWMKGINRQYLNSGAGAYFGQELNYDEGFKDTVFNGNIAGVRWRGWSDPVPRAYGYNYDKANRLIQAEFRQQTTASSPWIKDNTDFSVNWITYDANGNIGKMKQWGLDGIAKTEIDKLAYSYYPNSNKLRSVYDSSTVASALGDFKDGNPTSDDYRYDTVGNLIKDANKKIDAITYNHLNLPVLITIANKGTIKYQYDALGTKVRKIVTDMTGGQTKVTTTDYIGDFVYENDTLQFAGHEEGRIRAMFKTGMPVAYKYDYFIKDHLGNIRMVLTEQSDQGLYAATMETALLPTENALFSNIDITRVPKPVGYPTDATTSPNDYVARLNATNGAKIGPSLVLRVMAGDTLQIGSKAFYKSTAANTPVSTTPDMLAALLQAFGGQGIRDGAHSATGPGSPLAVTFNNSAYDNLKQKDPSQNLSDKPRAYLNYALFDDQFMMVNENSGVKQVQGTPDALQTLATDRMVIKKTGFIYIYTSNESAQDVFFDNVVVAHSSGPVLEETHYYPFGLTMAGISSNALKGANYAENRLKYNGKELQSKEFGDGAGLEWYDYGARMYDQQIGRWLVPDLLTEAAYDLTPFRYCFNNPVRFIDPYGLWEVTEGGYSTIDKKDI
ncbi:RHS repeat-associated core domain-containing protein, partial [Chitinophaga sp.]|uniref:RHS repeat-associated core domain-containing protein n=1 Tax=Chitinophaga sp. TaxID=1869181 RepID=UPI002F926A24